MNDESRVVTQQTKMMWHA